MLRNHTPKVMTAPKFEGGGIISFHEKDVSVPGPGQLLLQVGRQRALRLGTGAILRRQRGHARA